MKRFFDAATGNSTTTWIGESKEELWSGTRRVVFSPNGGMAHIYLRSASWNEPPVPGNGSELYKLAWLLSRASQGFDNGTGTKTLPSFERALGEPGQRPAVLLRNQSGDFAVFQAAAVLGEGVLVPLANIAGNPKWSDLHERLRNMAESGSQNSRCGDIVLIFDIKNEFIAVNDDKEEELQGWHGSPTPAESRVPLQIGFVGLGNELRGDNTLLTNAISGGAGNGPVRNAATARVAEMILMRLKGGE